MFHQLDDPDDKSAFSEIGAPAEEVWDLTTHFLCKKMILISNFDFNF